MGYICKKLIIMKELKTGTIIIEGEASKSSIGYHLRWTDLNGSERWAQGEFEIDTHPDDDQPIITHVQIDEMDGVEVTYGVIARI